MEAIEDYLRAHPGELDSDFQREAKFGCTFAPRGYFTKK
jgi:cephalosporin hydroxylase